MNPILAIVLAGLLGAVMMMIVIFALQSIGLTSPHLLASIGSLVTKKMDGASKVGLVIHLVSGIVFAFLYVLVWSYLDLRTIPELVMLGMLTGSLHAVAVSIAIVILVTEHHPLRRYQKVGFNVALTQVVAHVVFGIVVGFTMGTFEQDHGTLTAVADKVWPTLAH